jgi:hypothetical protein
MIQHLVCNQFDVQDVVTDHDNTFVSSVCEVSLSVAQKAYQTKCPHGGGLGGLAG